MSFKQKILITSSLSWITLHKLLAFDDVDMSCYDETAVKTVKYNWKIIDIIIKSHVSLPIELYSDYFADTPNVFFFNKISFSWYIKKFNYFLLINIVIYLNKYSWYISNIIDRFANDKKRKVDFVL